MKYDVIKKVIMTEKERQTIKDFVNFIEYCLRDDIEEDPDLVVQLLTGVFCGYDLINTSSGTVYVEYIQEREA